ncbi:MAG: hypothetical protein V4520_16355 [Bacteroidota bacterium]
MATSQKRPATATKATTKSTSQTDSNLKTDMPLSEKDEVKNAEQKVNRSAKKSS